MKAGEYYVLYRPDFKEYHKVRRLNIVFYSEFQPRKRGEELKIWEREQIEKKQEGGRLTMAASAQLLAPPSDQKLEENDIKKDVSEQKLMEGDQSRDNKDRDSTNSDMRRARSEARRNPPPEYKPELAIELERLD